ncbi:MAG: membrane protein insertion efficiency factor YidD [Candidatus Eremiobacteraeota bacterium]|nr:membrane protein insertion efficiency factor YidD [Candidatus Eremiobacteraeota bacterium]
MPVKKCRRESASGKSSRRAVTWFFCAALLLLLLDNLQSPSHQFSARAGVAVIELYQDSVSRGIYEAHGIRICRYTPSCSEYTRQSIQKHGFLRGTARGAWRIMRCNPWSPGGIDLP